MIYDYRIFLEIVFFDEDSIFTNSSASIKMSFILVPFINYSSEITSNQN
jgi:hypothetical protein